jgi:hypothetical protein
MAVTATEVDSRRHTMSARRLVPACRSMPPGTEGVAEARDFHGRGFDGASGMTPGATRDERARAFPAARGDRF